VGDPAECWWNLSNGEGWFSRKWKNREVKNKCSEKKRGDSPKAGRDLFLKKRRNGEGLRD